MCFVFATCAFAQEDFKHPPAAEICNNVSMITEVNGRKALFTAGFFDIQLIGPSPYSSRVSPSPRPGYVCRIIRKYFDEDEGVKIVEWNRYDSMDHKSLLGQNIPCLKKPWALTMAIAGGHVWVYFTSKGMELAPPMFYKVPLDWPGEPITSAIDYTKTSEMNDQARRMAHVSRQVKPVLLTDWEQQVYLQVRDDLKLTGMRDGILELRCGFIRGSPEQIEKRTTKYTQKIENERRSHQLLPNEFPPAREHLLTAEIVLGYDIERNRWNLTIPADTGDIFGVIIRTAKEEEEDRLERQKKSELETDRFDNGEF
jgi:hypothetical protein